MADSMQRWRRSRQWEFALAALAALGVAAAVVVAAIEAGPPIITNLATRVSDGLTPFPVGSDGLTAAVTVPEGWVVQPRDDGVLLVRTPDGVLSAHLEVVAQSADAALTAAPDVAGPSRMELLASGLRVAHGDLADGTGVIAAVELGDASAGGSTVLVITRISRPHSPPTYRPALAELLEGIS